MAATNRPPPARLPTAIDNRLLASLPDREYARIHPALDVIPVKVKQFLQRPGDKPRHMHFPEEGFCSALTVLENGTMVEVATIGREGVAGMLTRNGRSSGSSATMVQGPMRTCARMPADVFRREMDRRETFYRVVSEYQERLTRIIMQCTACNAVHSVEQRLARWLLTAHDHMRADRFALTQEFVAMMLGVARPTVATIAARLQRAGLIDYQRGQLSIVDRDAMEAAACECYRVTAQLIAAHEM